MSAAALTAGRGRAARLGAGLAPIGGLLAVLAVAAVATPDLYDRNNVTLILFLAGLIGITAVGQTLVLLTGGIDLSIGAVIGLTTVIVATRRTAAAPPCPRRSRSR